jgi:hypothetical protein
MIPARKRFGSFVAAALLALLMLSPSIVRAADLPPAGRADELIKQGFQLRLQGKNQEALEVYSKAHQIAPSAKTLGQVGSVELALHRWLDAEAHIEQALARRDSAWLGVARNRAMLERALLDARRQIARVRIDGTAGADVSVDGRRVGRLPLAAPVHVAAGTIRIEATAAGRQPADRRIAVQGGEEATVALALAPAVPIMGAAPGPAPAPAVLVSAALPEARTPAWRKWSGGALIGAGAAAVGVGVGWLIVDGRPSCDASAGAVCKNLYDTKKQGWIAVAAGGVAAGAGATLLLWPSKARSATIVVAPDGIGLAGQF